MLALVDLASKENVRVSVTTSTRYSNTCNMGATGIYVTHLHSYLGKCRDGHKDCPTAWDN